MPDWLNSSQVKNTMATVQIKQNNPSVVWEIQQISVLVSSKSTAGNVGIFKNGNMVTPTSALTPVVTPVGSGIGQTAAGDPYVYIRATDEIDIIVSSVTNGDVVTVRAQYREYLVTDPIAGSA